MDARAIARYIRISPTKARLVTDLIRGKNVSDALNILAFTNKKAARITTKLLFSAATNAQQKSPDLDLDQLKVKAVWVDPGPIHRRFIARAMGRATRIRKRTSHITIIVGETA